MKRGILFSITTLLLFTSLLIFPLSFDDPIVPRLGHIEDDIVSGSYSDLLDIEDIRITRGPALSIRFFTDIDMDVSYDARLNRYADLVEGRYSSLQNMDIDVSHLGRVQVEPYGSNISLDPFLMIGQASEGIGIVMLANSSNYTSVSETLQPGDKVINITLQNSTGGIIYSSSHMLDPASESRVIFELGEGTLDIIFGRFLSYPDGTLSVNSSADVSIRSFRRDHVPES